MSTRSEAQKKNIAARRLHCWCSPELRRSTKQHKERVALEPGGCRENGEGCGGVAADSTLLLLLRRVTGTGSAAARFRRAPPVDLGRVRTRKCISSCAMRREEGWQGRGEQWTDVRTGVRRRRRRQWRGSRRDCGSLEALCELGFGHLREGFAGFL